jgi:hypothetical protein
MTIFADFLLIFIENRDIIIKIGDLFIEKIAVESLKIAITLLLPILNNHTKKFFLNKIILTVHLVDQVI